MKIPKSLRIKGKLWRVYIEPVEKCRLGECDDDDEGACYPKLREIHLSSELRGRRLREIFAHELLHALLPYEGLVSITTEHKVINAMQAPLAEVLEQLGGRCVM